MAIFHRKLAGQWATTDCRLTDEAIFGAFAQVQGDAERVEADRWESSFQISGFLSAFDQAAL